MAERPTLISLGGPAEQLSYQLSQGEALRPETVAAQVDGTGASAPFVLQLSMLAASGEVLSRTRTDDTVAIGESGAVTFAPF